MPFPDERAHVSYCDVKGPYISSYMLPICAFPLRTTRLLAAFWRRIFCLTPTASVGNLRVEQQKHVGSEQTQIPIRRPRNQALSPTKIPGLICCNYSQLRVIKGLLIILSRERGAASSYISFSQRPLPRPLCLGHLALRPYR